MRYVVLTIVLHGMLFNGHSKDQERTEDSFIPNYAVAGSYFSWGGDADFETGGGSLSNLEYGAEANVPIFMREGFRMTTGVKYRHNTLDFSGAPVPFGSSQLNLHRVDLPVNGWFDLGQKWKLWAQLRPGWYSDFDTITSDDFILTSLALLSYQWNPTTKIAFGAYYSRDLSKEWAEQDFNLRRDKQRISRLRSKIPG